MTDDHDPNAPAADSADQDGELLAAWLAADLTPRQSATIEARLEREPALALRLDEIAAALTVARRLDDVAPPTGYEDRLRSRLATERTVTAIGAVTPAPAKPAWLGAQRLAAVAAALVLVAGVATLVTRLPITDDATDAALTQGLESAEGPTGTAAPDEAAARDQAADTDAVEDLTTLQHRVDDAADDGLPGGAAVDGRSDATGGDAGDSADVEESARAQGAAPGDGPEIVDDGVTLADDAAVRAHLGDLPSVAALRGTPAAADVAERFRAQLLAAPAFTSGAQPAVCLDSVTAGAQGPVVAARSESVIYAGAPAVAYVLVESSVGSGTLDRATVWVVAPADCTVRLFLELRDPAE